MMRQEKDSAPSDVHEPQRLVVSRNRTTLAFLPIDAVCLSTSASMSRLASRFRKSAIRRCRCRRSPWTNSAGEPFSVPTDGDEDESGRETIVVEVGGKRLEVSLPSSLGMTLARTGLAAGAKPKRRAAKKSGPAASGDTLASPMQGTIVKIAVEEGQQVNEGDLVVVLEAMKMEQPLNAHRTGTIKGLTAEVGASLTSGATICEIKD